MHKVHLSLIVPLAMFASQVAAQSQTAPVTTIQSAAPTNVLRTGTPIALKTREQLTTNGKKLRVGTRVQLEVAEPVLLNGKVIIPAGTPAVGEVTDVRNKGMWGKSGHINGRVLYALVNGSQVRLSGSFDDKGTTGTAGVVASIALVPVAGFFVTGTSANIPAGSTVNGFLDEDIVAAEAPVASLPASKAQVAPAPAAATK